MSVAALIFLMVAVGGGTRLTGSGLSIVEWRPVTGIVPPLSAAQWQAEFNKYKTIPQYRERNRGMSLSAFKAIYWWEWTHRLLGRAIGFAFLLPFLWFLWRGRIGRGLRLRLWAIFGLGAFQGAVGWWMVASGLVGRLSVSPYRLAFHLTLASVIFALCLWTAQRLTPQAPAWVARRIHAGAGVLLAMILAQLYLGALVAGTHAGLIYNTWPYIDGQFVPSAQALFFEHPWWRNFFENVLTVQFDHRMMAYAIWLGTIVHAFDIARTDPASPSLRSAFILGALVTVQASLGIATLLLSAPLVLALAHQIMAMIVFSAAVLHAAGMTGQAAARAATTLDPQAA